MKKRKTRKELERHIAHKDAAITVFINLVGSLVPIWGSYLVYLAFSKWQGDWAVFYKNGEFYLYSASFLTAAAVVFYKKKKQHYDVRSWMFWIMIIVLIIATFLYASFRVSEIIAVGDNKFNAKFLACSSYILMIFAVIMFYWSVLITNEAIEIVPPPPDLKAVSKQGESDLKKAFRQTS